jgi:hypothetical protein
MTAESFEMRDCLMDVVATWHISGAIAAAVCAIAAVSIFVMRDAPSLLSDPFLFLLTNR